MFKHGDIVRHKKTKGEYLIVLDKSDVLFIEKGNKQAYAYKLLKEANRVYPLWVRPVSEMEDGRFELLYNMGGS